MTTVYFVRHAEPNFDNHDDMTRELSAKGLSDRYLVLEYLKGKPVDAVLSSPFKRAVDTVLPVACDRKLNVVTVEGFRERKVSEVWIGDFSGYSQRQWMDFSYKLPGGESLSEVQKRNICALECVLKDYDGKTIVIGSHGTALSSIVNYYDPTFGYEAFRRIQNIMPWVVKFCFSGTDCIQIEEIKLIP